MCLLQQLDLTSSLCADAQIDRPAHTFSDAFAYEGTGSKSKLLKQNKICLNIEYTDFVDPLTTTCCCRDKDLALEFHTAAIKASLVGGQVLVAKYGDEDLIGMVALSGPGQAFPSTQGPYFWLYKYGRKDLINSYSVVDFMVYNRDYRSYQYKFSMEQPDHYGAAPGPCRVRTKRREAESRNPAWDIERRVFHEK